jgi:hypothetical protein
VTGGHQFDASTGRLRELAGRVRALPPPRIVAIDGGAGSGKSSFAARLAAMLYPAAIVPCDDLLDGWGGQFDFWPRLRTEILTPLRAGGTVRYRRFDWRAGRFAELATVAPTPTVLVEGVSAIAACGGAADFRIWLDVPRIERERRWAARDGAPLQPEWITWLDAEDRYYAGHPPVADVVITYEDRDEPG